MKCKDLADTRARVVHLVNLCSEFTDKTREFYTLLLPRLNGDLAGLGNGMSTEAAETLTPTWKSLSRGSARNGAVLWSKRKSS